MNQKNIKRGDIYYADLNPVFGSEQGGCRPVLVVQNNNGNKYSPTIVVTPITGNIYKNPLPTHVILPRSCCLVKDSLVLVEQIRTIDRSRIKEYIGHINEEQQSEIDKALDVCVGLEKRRPPKGEMLVLSLCPQCESDFRNNRYMLVKKGWQDVKENCDICKTAKGLNFGIF